MHILYEHFNYYCRFRRFIYWHIFIYWNTNLWKMRSHIYSFVQITLIPRTLLLFLEQKAAQNNASGLRKLVRRHRGDIILKYKQAKKIITTLLIFKLKKRVKKQKLFFIEIINLITKATYFINYTVRYCINGISLIVWFITNLKRSYRAE